MNLEPLALMHVFALQRRWDQPNSGDWANVLAKSPLFTEVSKRRLRKLARKAKFAEFAPGEPIILAGEPDDLLYIILAGHAKTVSRGDRQVLRAGEYLGEIALIDGRPRSATVVAMSYVQVMKLPASSVLKLARQKPAMTLTMLKHLTTRLRHLEAQLARSA